MKISFEGCVWEFDEDRVTVQQAITMHLVHGLTLQGWIEGIKEMDPRAWQCSYWLMLQQNGIMKPLKDCEFPVIEFMTAYSEAQNAEAPAEPEPDPTSPSLADGAPASAGSATPPGTIPPLPVPAPSTVSLGDRSVNCAMSTCSTWPGSAARDRVRRRP